jgi:hypothetical protein
MPGTSSFTERTRLIGPRPTPARRLSLLADGALGPDSGTGLLDDVEDVPVRVTQPKHRDRE